MPHAHVVVDGEEKPVRRYEIQTTHGRKLEVWVHSSQSTVLELYPGVDVCVSEFADSKDGRFGVQRFDGFWELARGHQELVEFLCPESLSWRLSAESSPPVWVGFKDEKLRAVVAASRPAAIKRSKRSRRVKRTLETGL